MLYSVIVSPLPPPNLHSLNWLCSRKDAQQQCFQPTTNLFRIRVPKTYPLSSCMQSTENEEAQAVVFSFNYDTPALVPIYELVWNVKVDDIDPQQFTRMK